MIKKDSILKMAALLKMDAAAVTAAFDNKEEVDVKVTEGLNIFSADELSQREAQVKAGAAEAAQDILIKTMKEEAGLAYDGQGSKDPKRFVTELTKKAVTEAKIPVDKKVEELTTTAEALRTKLMEAQKLVQDKDTQMRVSKHDTILLTNTIHLKPDNFTNDEWIGLIKAGGISLEDTEAGGVVVKRGGEIVKDTKLLKEVPVDKALADFVTEKKWGKVDPAPTPGRGGSDTKHKPGALPIDKAAVTKMSDLVGYCEANGIDIKSAQGHAILTEISTANTDFDFNG